MRIDSIIFNSQPKQTPQRYVYRTKPMPFDSVSFGAMKKTQFSGIDLMMVNQLKAPIQKFNSNDDFQNYCKDILNKNYLGKKNIEALSNSYDTEAQMHKEAILKEWINYITVENEAYTPSIQLMILSSITKNLSCNTNHLPPVLDKRRLADTIYEIQNNAKTQKNYSCNFDKIYRNNLLAATFEEETQLDKNLNGWVRISGRDKDSQNFEANVKKLQILSHNSWCTKTYNAEPYLAKGDFHIYLEDGKPKLGLRFSGEELVEIQGEKNNGKVPFLYSQKLSEYIDEQGFLVANSLKDEIDNAKKQKMFYDSVGEEAVKNKDLEKILPFFCFKFEKDANGMLIIDHYYGSESFKGFPLELSDFGISRNDILAKTSKVKGDFRLQLDDEVMMGGVEEICGSFVDDYSKIETLGKVKKIGKNLYADCAFDLKSLGDLKYVGGDIELTYFDVFKDQILKLDYIGGALSFYDYGLFERANLLLKSTPLSRPVTFEEYREWQIDDKDLNDEEVQKLINNADFDTMMENIFGDDWLY